MGKNKKSSWDSQGFMKLESPEYGEIIICRYKWVLNQAAKKGKFAISPEELQTLKNLKNKQERDEMIHGLKMVRAAVEICRGEEK